MAETEPMDVNERRKYLHKKRIRYWQAKAKKAKGALLDEMATVTNLHREVLGNMGGILMIAQTIAMLS